MEASSEEWDETLQRQIAELRERWEWVLTDITEYKTPFVKRFNFDNSKLKSGESPVSHAEAYNRDIRQVKWMLDLLDGLRKQFIQDQEEKAALEKLAVDAVHQLEALSDENDLRHELLEAQIDNLADMRAQRKAEEIAKSGGSGGSSGSSATGRTPMSLEAHGDKEIEVALCGGPLTDALERQDVKPADVRWIRPVPVGLLEVATNSGRVYTYSEAADVHSGEQVLVLVATSKHPAVKPS